MPKKDEKKPHEKEVYRLWWEYLKRSEAYKAYCSLVPIAMKRIRKKHGSLKNTLTKLMSAEYPFKQTDPMSLLFEDYMWRNWEYFGDVFNDSFDDWWKQNKPSIITLPVLVLNDPLHRKFLTFFAEEFRRQQKARKKPLSPEETLKILTEAEWNFIFLAVPMIGGVTMEEISKQIADIRKKWADKFDIEDFYMRRFVKPVGRVRFDEMKRYLRVYDLWKQGLKMKEIIAKIDPERRGDDADVLRSFRNDLQKAKKIISNVESGSFPEEPQF